MLMLSAPHHHPSPRSPGDSAATSPIDARFQRITRIAQRLFGTPVAALSLMDGERRWFTAVHGLEPARTPCPVQFCGYTILHDNVMIVPDARQDPRFTDSPQVKGEPHVVFYAGCPLRTPDGNRVATLCVLDFKPRELTAEDERILRDLAALAELELREAFQHAVQEDLVSQIDAERKRVLVDPLTRIWSRAGVMDALTEELDHAAKQRRPFALAMADLVRFKNVNDTRGHPAGDEVLRQTARRMVDGLRDTDSIGRYGGEEFLLVLGNSATRAEAVAAADSVRSAVSHAPTVTEAGPIPVTVSIGVAFVDDASRTSVDEMIAAADRALYQAKHSGRNRIEWEELGAGKKAQPRRAVA